MSRLPALGPQAFALGADDLFGIAQNAPEEEQRELVLDFAHDLAAITTLPTAREGIPAEELATPRLSPLEKLFGITPPTKEES